MNDGKSQRVMECDGDVLGFVCDAGECKGWWLSWKIGLKGVL